MWHPFPDDADPRCSGDGLLPELDLGRPADRCGVATRRSLLRFAIFCSAVALTLPTDDAAAQVRDGPPITFIQRGIDPDHPENQDRITDSVWLSRAKTRGLFNAKSEAGYGPGSPAGTRWAFGRLEDLATLRFEDWETWNGRFPPGMAGQEAVLHLVPDDIYLAITFKSWGRWSGGGFSYTRSTPRPLPTPPRLTFRTPLDLTLEGVASATYRLEASLAVSPATWIPVARLTLTNSLQSHSDDSSQEQPRRFYRVVLLP